MADYQARVNPELRCDTVLKACEWQSLSATINKIISRDNPPSLRQTVLMITT
ncbi:hypothetical protein LC608_27810 [Nostoc sp. XA010]|uniref:hypothetical protein n=1 Tax=Nostoc sp. XA010 TaxID=2780407 RepID=UPI001E5E6F5D|nr:hypothetical protein [Nostoc sp. XA010]MCC5660714.1 hypothetical protein [Nostoc sp. XA010]